MWAWLLFRVSGLVLAIYLVVHIVVLSQGRVAGPERLNAALTLFDRPVFVLLDLLLVWAVLFHAFNGVRVVLMDLGVGIRRHKAVFIALLALGLLSLSCFAVEAVRFISGA